MWRRAVLGIWMSALALGVGSGVAVAVEPQPTPMTFQVVTLDDPRCADACPQWIAADGKFVQGTAAAFSRVLASLHGRRLPILIRSPGGVVDEAMAMGRQVRAARLAVGVAATTLTPCPAHAAACAPKGTADGFTGYCASACVQFLASGVERYASPLAFIGVHQIKLVYTRLSTVKYYRVRYRIVDGKREEIDRTLTGEKQTQTHGEGAATPAEQSAAAAYFAEMGIDPSLNELANQTPPSSIHRLTADEEMKARILTAWFDARSPVLADPDANGLTGMAVEGSSGGHAYCEASAERPLGEGASSPRAHLSLTYRRGGGAVIATVAVTTEATGAGADANDISAFRLVFGPGLEVLAPYDRAGAATHPAAIPLATVCALSKSPDLRLSVVDGVASKDLVVAKADMAGLPALLDEVCTNAASPLKLGVVPERREGMTLAQTSPLPAPSAPVPTPHLGPPSAPDAPVCALQAPTEAGVVKGVAGDWIPQSQAVDAVMAAERALHGPMTQKYLLMPRIHVSVPLRGAMLSVFAAVPPGLTVHKGDSVAVTLRHRDPDTACSYIPYIVTRVLSGEI